MPVRVDRLPRRLTNRSRPAELERITFPAPLQNTVAPLKFHHWQAEILHNTLPLLPLYYISPCFHFRPSSFPPKCDFFILLQADILLTHNRSGFATVQITVNLKRRNVLCKCVGHLSVTIFIVINCWRLDSLSVSHSFLYLLRYRAKVENVKPSINDTKDHFRAGRRRTRILLYRPDFWNPAGEGVDKGELTHLPRDLRHYTEIHMRNQLKQLQLFI